MPKATKGKRAKIEKIKRDRRKTLRKNPKVNEKSKRGISNEQKSRIVKTFFEILHSIKLYHWKTKSYSHTSGGKKKGYGTHLHKLL